MHSVLLLLSVVVDVVLILSEIHVLYDFLVARVKLSRHTGEHQVSNIEVIWVCAALKVMVLAVLVRNRVIDPAFLVWNRV